jgi:acyl-coenzyme A thioesterase PaaI-like protein
MSTNGPGRAELRRTAAQALRRLAHGLVAHEPDDAALAGVAADAARLAECVEGAPRRRRGDDVVELLPLLTDPARDDFSSVLGERPVSGAANPTAADVIFRRDGDEIVAEVRFGPAFEGAPGRVHGGMVAAVFDDVTGGALALARAPAYTARLSVDYLAPVPVDVPVEFRTRLERRDGRKLHVTCVARHGTEVVARAEALFIAMPPGSVPASRVVTAPDPGRGVQSVNAARRSSSTWCLPSPGPPVRRSRSLTSAGASAAVMIDGRSVWCRKECRLAVGRPGRPQPGAREENP